MEEKNEENRDFADNGGFEVIKVEKETQPKKRGGRAKNTKAEIEEVLSEDLRGKKDKEITREEKKRWPEREGQLAVDVFQTDDEVIIQTAIAGVQPEDLDVTAQGDKVVIRGKREKSKEIQGKNYFYQECYWGLFSREIILPVEADTARAQASMNDGILTIRIPKIIKEGEKKITVK